MQWKLSKSWQNCFRKIANVLSTNSTDILLKVMAEAVHWQMSETEVSILTAPHPITFCRDQLSALCCHYILLPMQTRKLWKTSWLVWRFWLLLPGIHPLANAVCMAISCKLHTSTITYPKVITYLIKSEITLLIFIPRLFILLTLAKTEMIYPKNVGA